MVVPILSTKLHRPPIVSDHVHRSQLLERLDQRRQRPLTLVTAPAGYGKSTLVCCWLEAYDLLTEILKHPPHAMHLVLTSRIDPPLPLTSLRARGEMTEIRVQDLRFTIEETAEYLQKMLGETISFAEII